MANCRYQRKKHFPKLLLLISPVLLLIYSGLRDNRLVVHTTVGGVAVLPCEVEWQPKDPNATLDVEWNRPHLPPGHYVHYLRNGKEFDPNKNPEYQNRTSLFMDEVKKGNVSLKLSNVKSSDEGIYTCHIDEFKTNTTVELIVGPGRSTGSTDDNRLVVHATVGGDAVLPCKVEWQPKGPNDTLDVLWSRTDLPEGHYVHYLRNGKEFDPNKNAEYKNRTSLFIDEVKKGNMSLKLSNVKSSDAGIYTCYIDEFKTNTTVQLIVLDVPKEWSNATKNGTDAGLSVPPSTTPGLVWGIVGVITVAVAVATVAVLKRVGVLPCCCQRPPNQPMGAAEPHELQAMNRNTINMQGGGDHDLN